jgi:hypothetical protein
MKVFLLNVLTAASFERKVKKIVCSTSEFTLYYIFLLIPLKHHVQNANKNKLSFITASPTCGNLILRWLKVGPSARVTVFYFIQKRIFLGPTKDYFVYFSVYEGAIVFF